MVKGEDKTITRAVHFPITKVTEQMLQMLAKSAGWELMEAICPTE